MDIRIEDLIKDGESFANNQHLGRDNKLYLKQNCQSTFFEWANSSLMFLQCEYPNHPGKSESILHLHVDSMAVDQCIAAKRVEHIVPVDTHVPFSPKLLADRQAAIYGYACRLAPGRLLGVVHHLCANLPQAGKKDCGG